MVSIRTGGANCAVIHSFIHSFIHSSSWTGEAHLNIDLDSIFNSLEAVSWGFSIELFDFENFRIFVSLLHYSITSYSKITIFDEVCILLNFIYWWYYLYEISHSGWFRTFVMLWKKLLFETSQDQCTHQQIFQRLWTERVLYSLKRIKNWEEWWLVDITVRNMAKSKYPSVYSRFRLMIATIHLMYP